MSKGNYATWLLLTLAMIFIDAPVWAIVTMPVCATAAWAYLMGAGK